MGGIEDDLAIDTLVRLAHDEDRETRNWAVFGLGSLSESQAPEAVYALLGALAEADDEIRGEALVGLAKRHHPLVRDALLREWADGEFGSLSLEAAEELGDPALAPRLAELLEASSPQNQAWVHRYLSRAIAACTENSGST